MKKLSRSLAFLLLFLGLCFCEDNLDNTTTTSPPPKRSRRHREDEASLSAIPFGIYCRGPDPALLPFGPCSDRYLRCRGNGEYRIESCNHGEVLLEGKCQSALKSLVCFNQEVNRLNAAAVKLANAVRACDASPGILADLSSKCPRQALVCEPSAEPIAFSCPVGHAIDFSTLKCVKDEVCSDYRTTQIQDLLVSTYCRYLPSEDHAGTVSTDYLYGFNQAFCQDWYVDCQTGQFVYCDVGKVFDKKEGYCRLQTVADQCSVQTCRNWEWMRVPVGQCSSEFVFCQGNTPRLFRCPHDKLFSQGECQPRHKIEECHTCEPGERKEAEHCKEYFECRPSLDAQDPWLHQTCPDGQFFNRKYKVCEHAEDGVCADYKTCVDGESFQPACGDYLICYSGRFQPGRCPHLTRWSRKDRQCIPDNSCKRYQTTGNACRPGDMIRTADCKTYYQCNARTGKFDKAFCKEVALGISGPCDYCQNSQPQEPYSSSNDVSDVYCQENSKFVDPEDCSRYVECVNSRYVERECIDGSLFDPEAGRCSQNPKVRCKRFGQANSVFVPPPRDFDRRFGQSALPPAPPPEWIEERQQVFERAGQRVCNRNSPLLPDPRDCGVYHKCIGGSYMQELCPPGTNFHERSQSCRRGSEHCMAQPAERCNSGDKIALPICGKVMSCVNGQWSRKKCKNDMAFVDGRCSRDISCDGFRPEPQQYPQQQEYAYQDDDDCTRYFTVVDGVVTQRQCTNGQKFDETKGLCSYSYTCSKNAPSCYENEVKKVDKDCEKYLQCMSGRFVEKSCPYNHHFKEQQKRCIYGKCAGLPQADSCTESAGLAGFRKDDNDCRKFYQCAAGKWVHKDCAPGTAFAPQIGVCDHIRNVPDCVRQK